MGASRVTKYMFIVVLNCTINKHRNLLHWPYFFLVALLPVSLSPLCLMLTKIASLTAVVTSVMSLEQKERNQLDKENSIMGAL